MKFLLPLLAVAAGTAVAAETDAAPAEQLKALTTAFNKAAYDHNNNTAATEKEKSELAATMAKMTLDCLALARAHPREPVALEALTNVITQEYWLANYSNHPGWGRESPQAAAIAIVLRNHLESDKLADTCRRVSYCFRQECEDLLRAALGKSPHRDVRGTACLRLAQFLAYREQKIDLLNSQPESAQRWEQFFGSEYLTLLRTRDRAAVLREIESVYGQAIAQYSDVALPYGGTVGEFAKRELYEIRYLAPGKEAPEITGIDQDGKEFKLSDYRGKAVLLYFWSAY
jgi:hypothetical protein